MLKLYNHLIGYYFISFYYRAYIVKFYILVYNFLTEERDITENSHNENESLFTETKWLTKFAL